MRSLGYGAELTFNRGRFTPTSFWLCRSARRSHGGIQGTRRAILPCCLHTRKCLITKLNVDKRGSRVGSKGRMRSACTPQVTVCAPGTLKSTKKVTYNNNNNRVPQLFVRCHPTPSQVPYFLPVSSSWAVGCAILGRQLVGLPSCQPDTVKAAKLASLWE